jgi:glucose-6-phosphate 1-dehydrogenase
MARPQKNDVNPDAAQAQAKSADALAVFGSTGDLAHKKILPALYGMGKSVALKVPVIGIASSRWSIEKFRARARESVELQGSAVDALRVTLRGALRPAFYLVIPPALFPTVIRGLKAAGLAEGGRVIVEKLFDRDLASARELNRIGLEVFPEDAIFRIDHFLGKEAIMNILYFRFANSFLEPIWNRHHIARSLGGRGFSDYPQSG